MGHQSKVIKDFGLSAMSVFGLLIAIFIGIRLMVQEMEQRTIFVVASKSIHRWEIVIGKYLGLALTLAVNVILMSFALWGAGFLMEGRIDFTLAPAILLIYVEILLIIAFALLFSMFTSPTLSAIFTLIVFIIGHLSGFLREYVELYPDRGLHWLFRMIYLVVPNLENLNLKMAVVEHLPQPPHAFTHGLFYGIAYLLIVLILTAVIFQKKDIK